VLWFAASNILALLLWYLILNAVTTGALRISLSASVGPAQHPGRFDWVVLRSTARYSIGVSAILLMLTLLSQLDRVVLSRLVTLDVFGNYMLAVTVTGALGYLAAPVTGALYPRLVRAYTQNDQVELTRNYHLCSQLVNFLVIPAAAVLVFFAQPVLGAWTGNPDVALKSAPLMRLLAVSTGVSLLINCTFVLQAACGWNRLVFYQQLCAVVLMSLLLLALVPSLGALGAAWAWVAVNLSQAAFGPYLMHRRLLRGEFGRWLRGDVLMPGAVAVLCVWSSAALMPDRMGRLTVATWLVTTFSIASLLHLACSSELRPRLLAYVRTAGVRAGNG
jgi:O-antigen/teichoic acid export membrane protein